MDSKFLINSIYENNNDIFEQAEKRCYAKLGFYFEKYQKIKNKNNKKIIPKKNINMKNNKTENDQINLNHNNSFKKKYNEISKSFNKIAYNLKKKDEEMEMKK